MGVPAQSLSMILAEHKREPFTGPVLSYGVQLTNVPMSAARWLFDHAGIEPDPAGLAEPPAEPECITFARIVRMLGLGEMRTLDVSAYEGADIVHDLNRPIPPEYHGRFGFVLDGGTMEHVFDLRAGMKNTADLLKPGGRVYHLSPMANYVNHGFVQISPTFYHDFYTANGFEDIRGLIVMHPRDGYDAAKWNFIRYNHELMGGVNSMFPSEDTQVALYFTARKTAASTSDRVPIQSYFTRIDAQNPLPAYRFKLGHSVANPVFEALPPLENAPVPGTTIGSIIL